MRIILGGDTMLGRLVKKVIKKHGVNYPMHALSPIFQRGDLNILNLECAITSHPQHWSGPEKYFYFGAPPKAVQILENLNIDIVNLANNHALDFNYQGLLDTFEYLKKYNINYTGAGSNIDEALKPAIITKNDIKFGMVGFCDHQADFSATNKNPGIAYLNLYNKENALSRIRNSLEIMLQANVEWPILSLHWGPNMVDRPPAEFIDIAHQAIDMGYKMLFGHSAHTFHGIEIYHNCPIIYAAGDLVDDYAVDPYYRNDHQLLFELELENKKLKRIFLYPVFIDSYHVKPAVDDQFDWIAEKMIYLCQEMGTIVKPYDKQRLIIEA